MVLLFLLLKPLTLKLNILKTVQAMTSSLIDFSQNLFGKILGHSDMYCTLTLRLFRVVPIAMIFKLI